MWLIWVCITNIREFPSRFYRPNDEGLYNSLFIVLCIYKRVCLPDIIFCDGIHTVIGDFNTTRRCSESSSRVVLAPVQLVNIFLHRYSSFYFQTADKFKRYNLTLTVCFYFFF